MCRTRWIVSYFSRLIFEPWIITTRTLLLLLLRHQCMTTKCTTKICRWALEVRLMYILDRLLVRLLVVNVVVVAAAAVVFGFFCCSGFCVVVIVAAAAAAVSVVAAAAAGFLGFLGCNGCRSCYCCCCHFSWFVIQILLFSLTSSYRTIVSLFCNCEPYQHRYKRQMILCLPYEKYFVPYSLTINCTN